MSRGRTRKLLPAAVLVLAGALAGTTALAENPNAWRRAAAKLGNALEHELGLAEKATELQAAVEILERERLSTEYDAAILDHAGRESMRRLDAYREGRAEREGRVSSRARAMYKLSRGGLMRFALEDLAGEGEQSTAERVATGRALRWLVSHDLEEMSAYQRAEVRAEAELLAATRELQALSALATVQTMQQRALDEAREQVRPELRQARRKRKRIAGSDRTSERALQAQKAMLQEAGRHWRELSRLRGVGRRGKVVRPVRGKIMGGFGRYEDEILELPMVRDGVELRARPDEPVRVIDDGRVVLVSRLPGFEDVVVVDHGSGELSMTGRLWKVEVEEGAEVERGTVLGHAAPKAIDDGLGRTVYLEIRHGDRPVDPAPYLRKAVRMRND